MNAETLSITLPAEMAQMIRDKVAAGRYSSSSEVIREAVHLWQDRNAEKERRLEAIRAKIQDAIDDPVRITDKEMRAHFERLTVEAMNRKAS